MISYMTLEHAVPSSLVIDTTPLKDTQPMQNQPHMQSNHNTPLMMFNAARSTHELHGLVWTCVALLFVHL